MSILSVAQLPTAAVVIPCYNAEKWIARAIRSALEQEYPNLELIVIDDGSTDGSLEVIKSFGQQLRWETGPNRGGCAARNRGLELASADFILFLDADDYIEGTLIKDLARTGQQRCLDLVIGVSLAERDGRRVEYYRSLRAESGRDDILKAWLDGPFVQTGALMWSTSFLRGIGGWDVRVRRRQDVELAIRALLGGARAIATTHSTAIWFEHASVSRVSRNHSKAAVASDYNLYLRLMSKFPELKSRWAPEMAARFYSIAYEAHLYGFNVIGADALHQARQLGLKGHLGSARHKFFSALLGLRWKLLLSRWRLHYRDGVLFQKILPPRWRAGTI